MSVNESLHAGRWIEESLEGVGLSGYPDIAPASAPDPHAIYSLGGSQDTYYTPARRALVRMVFAVKVVGTSGSYGPLKVYADAIDDTLHGAVNVLVAEGVRVAGCRRDSLIRYAELVDGEVWRHLGGQYLLYLSPP